MQKKNLLEKLADNIVNFSLNAKKDEVVYVWASPDSKPLVEMISKKCEEVGAVPLFHLHDEELVKYFLKTLPDDEKIAANYIDDFLGVNHYLLDHSVAFIGIRSKDTDNPYEGVTQEKLVLWQKAVGKIFQRFTKEKKWVICDWPTVNQAEKANMSYEDFYDYALRVSAMNYQALFQKAVPLKELMDKTDHIHIKGKGTDLTFRKKGINTIIGAAKNSYIDGEVYTAPLRDSIDGYLTYTIPSVYMGSRFEGVRFEFSKGKIVKATCDKGSEEMLNKILDMDAGSRYIGEFALGINTEVTKPMDDIQYDEKNIYSFHFTPGQSYDEAPNGNDSSLHWDLVSMQTLEYGGGEIWFDGVLIKKDGLFVLPELQSLNPD